MRFELKRLRFKPSVGESWTNIYDKSELYCACASLSVPTQ